MNMEKATMKAAFPETKKNGVGIAPSDFLDRPRVKKESVVLRRMLRC